MSKIKKGKYSYYRSQITLPDGTKKDITAKSKAELKEKETAIRAKHKMRLAAGYMPTVAEYTIKQLSLIKPTVSRATYVGYESKARNYIVPALGNMPLSDVTMDDVRTALQPMETMSSSSYRLTHSLLMRIFTAAKQNRLISDNPMDGVRCKGGKPKKDIPSLADDQIKVLLEAVKGLSVETFVLLGLYAGLRREEILALQWDCVELDGDTPHIQIRRAWRIEHNRPVVSEVLKTPAAKRDIPIPAVLADHLRLIKKRSKSDYVVANRTGSSLSGSQWRELWKKVTVRTSEPHVYYRKENGKSVKHTVIPKLGEAIPHNPRVICSMDFHVTPHQLRHTYITNLIYSGADPKTVQYLAGHENSKITMDIYASVKYNRPEDLAHAINRAFDAA